MNSTVNENRMTRESRELTVHATVFALSLATVFVSSFFSRKVGACGTAQYLFFHLLGGMIAGIIDSIGPTHYERAIEQGAAVIFNVLAFTLVARVWYRNAPKRLYVGGLVIGTALYVMSYFFFFPTRDCP